MGFDKTIMVQTLSKDKQILGKILEASKKLDTPTHAGVQHIIMQMLFHHVSIPECYVGGLIT